MFLFSLSQAPTLVLGREQDQDITAWDWSDEVTAVAESVREPAAGTARGDHTAGQPEVSTAARQQPGGPPKESTGAWKHWIS